MFYVWMQLMIWDTAVTVELLLYDTTYSTVINLYMFESLPDVLVFICYL